MKWCILFFLFVNLISSHLAYASFVSKVGGVPGFVHSLQIGEMVFYPPFTFILTYLRHKGAYPTLLSSGFLIFFIGFIVSILGPGIYRYATRDKSLDLTSSGTAHWASEADLKRKHLLSDPNKPEDGVIVGAWDSGLNYEFRYKMAGVISKFPLFLNSLERKISFPLVFLLNHLPFTRKYRWKAHEGSGRAWDIRKVLKFIPGKRWYIVDNEKTHILMCAPSRSGKGIGVVIPTCINWQGSMVCADPKGENLDTTGAYLEKVLHHKVIKFDPAEAGNFYRWNTLNEVRWGTPNEGRDVSNIVQVLVGQGEGNDAHWIENGKDLIIGCITHLKYKDCVYNTVHDLHPGDKEYRETSMYDVYQFMAAGMTASDDEEDEENPNAPTGFRKVLRDEIVDSPDKVDKNGNVVKKGHKAVQHFPDTGVVFEVPNPYGTSSDAFLKLRITPENADKVTHFTPEARLTPHLHPVVVAKFNSFIGKPPNEAGSVLSTAVTSLMIFSEKTIIDNTSKSDFYLHDIRNSDRPVDLFLVTPPSDLARVGKIFRLIIELMVVSSTQKLNGDKYKCLLLIDEFPAFGKMENLLAELGYIAGYGLKALMIIQGLEQLKKIYKNLDLLTNCQTQVYFGPNDNDTRKHLSELLGSKTIMVKQRHADAGIFGKVDYTYVEKDRPLLRPDETSTFLANKSAMQIEGLLVLSPKNKFYEMPDMISKIDQGHALDPFQKVGLIDRD